MRFSYCLPLVVLLAACGDPLARVEKLSDVELVEEPAAQALPSEAELAREGGFFSRLLKRDPVQVDADAAVASASVSRTEPVDNAAPSDTAVLTAPEPFSEGEASVASEEASNGVVAIDNAEMAPLASDAPKKTGLLGWLKPSVDKEISASPAADTEAAILVSDSQEAGGQETEEDVSGKANAKDLEVVPAPLVEPKKRRVFFGLARPTDADVPVRTASLAPDPLPDRPQAQAEPKKARGLFGARTGRNAIRSGVDAKDVPYGTLLPYGEVARVCEAQRKSMGRKLDKAPARGKGYALYDSAPESTGPRTFYVTGFGDGCPRQFTAALALFGAPSVHEQLRYGRPSDEYPYSTTDKAYEKVKSSACGVSRRKPCGNKINEVERNTVFISTYERFSDNARWADILIHDGVVLAASIKKP